MNNSLRFEPSSLRPRFLALVPGIVLWLAVTFVGVQATWLPPESSLVSVSGGVEAMLVLDRQSKAAADGKPAGRIELHLDSTGATFVSRFPECAGKLAKALSPGEPVTIWMEAPRAVQKAGGRGPGPETGVLEIRKLQAGGETVIAYADSVRLQRGERRAFLGVSGSIGLALGLWLLTRRRPDSFGVRGWSNS